MKKTGILSGLVLAACLLPAVCFASEADTEPYPVETETRTQTSEIGELSSNNVVVRHFDEQGLVTKTETSDTLDGTTSSGEVNIRYEFDDRGNPILMEFSGGEELTVSIENTYEDGEITEVSIDRMTSGDEEIYGDAASLSHDEYGAALCSTFVNVLEMISSNTNYVNTDIVFTCFDIDTSARIRDGKPEYTSTEAAGMLTEIQESDTPGENHESVTSVSRWEDGGWTVYNTTAYERDADDVIRHISLSGQSGTFEGDVVYSEETDSGTGEKILRGRVDIETADGVNPPEIIYYFNEDDEIYRWDLDGIQSYYYDDQHRPIRSEVNPTESLSTVTEWSYR